MAKNEKITGRASALADDGFADAFYRPEASPPLRPEPVARFQAPDPQDEDAFLRARRRIPVRKSILPRTRAGQVALAAGTLLGVASIAMLAIAARDLLKRDPRFRIDSSDSIQILGNSQVTRPELLSVFGSDIGRNVFFVPLAERRAELESLPWVEHATVMRLLPNQMRVAVVERTPVAFVRTGNEIGLVDASGVILTMPTAMIAAKHYSFPVVTGIEAGDPLSTRTARMHIYQKFIGDLDAGGERISAQLSEIDLSDPEDVKAVIPSSGSDLLLHFGDQDFLARFHNYRAHLADWRQQYPHLASIDLRYERQVVLQMDKTTPPAADIVASPKEALDNRSNPPAKSERISPGGNGLQATPTLHPHALPSGKLNRRLARSTHKPARNEARRDHWALPNAVPYSASYPVAHPTQPDVRQNGTTANEAAQ